MLIPLLIAFERPQISPVIRQSLASRMASTAPSYKRDHHGNRISAENAAFDVGLIWIAKAQNALCTHIGRIGISL